MRWEREKISFQVTVREAGVRTDELQEKTKYQEILIEEYKQESKKKKLELQEQAQLINDILKECAKARREKERQVTLHQELKKMLTSWRE